MMQLILIDSLLLGVQHSFEPDHIAAVSVLAADKAGKPVPLPRLVWKSTQWAFGHSLAMIFFSLSILVLNFYVSQALSEFAENHLIGPLMILLGVSAFFRIYNFKPANYISSKLNFKPQNQSGQKLNRSFAVGMLHGLAGTGAACSIALTMAADNVYLALTVIAVQCLGILFAMTLYSLFLMNFISRAGSSNRTFLNYINFIVGVASVTIGIYYYI